MNIKREIETYMRGLDYTEGLLNALFVFPDEFVGFHGHFPREKVLPGVCQIQSVVVMIERHTGRDFHMKEIRSVKFLSPVLPGEEIECVCSMKEEAGGDIVVKAVMKKAGKEISELKFRGLLRG